MIHVMISSYIAIYEYHILHILYDIDIYFVCMISWSEQKKKGGAWVRVKTYDTCYDIMLYRNMNIICYMM